jgi:translation initiation factor IF-2
MTLKDFAIKYNLNSQELLDVLIFEKFPIQTIDDEIDNRLLKYLLEYTNKKNKNKAIQKNKKHNNNNVNAVNQEFKEKKAPKKEVFLYEEAMTISECISLTNIPASHYINFFLKRKKLYSINSLLQKEDIIAFAEEHKIPIIKKDSSENIAINETLDKKTNTIGKEQRNPIVVIVGHVDHGKTTLLDTIRKKSVAKSEKGGITQHVGAYEVECENKAITFLDTPGHEAFTALRSRGITIADIGVLVIAADDGVKPQTVESIKMLKQLKVNIIIAITKIDRLEGKNYDHIYTTLTSFDLVPESWGGNIPVVFICAPKEEGIAQLLETILLIADLADLKTNTNINASGYILETKLEKGRGIVTTILLQEGKFKIGDFFYCNDVWGKITSCVNAHGKNCTELFPGKPYVISGFSSFPEVGGNILQSTLKLAKTNAEEYKNSALNQKNNLQQKNMLSNNNNKKPYNIIIKADVFSSLQAIEKAIENFKADAEIFYSPIIIHQSLGEITENDINTAINSHAVIYLFNVKKNINKELSDLIEKNKISVLHFDVIYHMLEQIEKEIKEEKNKEPVLKKIGEAIVLKLFVIKGIGQIVGFRVVQGVIKISAMAMVYRNKMLIGKGIIRSLQKEKQSVKELTKGHEGAFSLPAVATFKEEDIIEIYSE